VANLELTREEEEALHFTPGLDQTSTAALTQLYQTLATKFFQGGGGEAFQNVTISQI